MTFALILDVLLRIEKILIVLFQPFHHRSELLGLFSARGTRLNNLVELV